MPHPTVLRIHERTLHAQSPRSLQQRTREGKLLRLAPGQYVDPDGLDGEQLWKARLQAHLRRAPEGSAISHRAAARLHAFEGFDDLADDVSVPLTSGWRRLPAIRCGAVPDEDVVLVDGIRTTSVALTLADLGRVVTADQLEFAVEFALRGENRRRPDQWNTKLLADLRLRVALASHLQCHRVLAVVLDRRGDERPCGSYVETLVAQALRAHGISLTRQPTVTVIRGRKRQNYFPDFGDLLRGLLIEIDGAVGHSGDEKWDRDDRRQNDLVRGFRVLRFHARTVLADPDAVARQIITVLNSMRVRPATFTHAGATVTVTGRSATLAF